MKKLYLPLWVFSLLLTTADAQISIVTSGNTGATTVYSTATAWFTNVSVQAGDILVVSHGNNKRTTTNTITASFDAGPNTFSSVSSGDSGGQSGAWLFYSEITQAGTYSIFMDTNSATKTVSHASSYYVIRAGAGQELNIADTAGAAGTGLTSVGLNFSFNSGYQDTLSLTAAAIQTGTITGLPAGWSTDLDRSAKRLNMSLVDFAGTSLSATWSTGAADNLSAAGLVITATAIPIPEPSTYAAIIGLMALGLTAWRRQRVKRL